MKHHFITLCMGILCICSCGKNYNNGGVTPSPTGTYTLESVFTDLAVTPKTVTINASTGGTFNGTSGSRYVFPANAFKKSDGSLATGDVTITVAEYLKRSDMIFSRVLPITATGAPLESAGEFYMNATQGSETLSIDPATTYKVNMPVKNASPGMSLYTGTKDPLSGFVSWNLLLDSSGKKIIYNGDTTSVITNTAGFTNADQPIPPNLIPITLHLTANNKPLGDSSLNVFGAIDGKLSAFIVNGRFFNSAMDVNLIQTMPLHFIAVAIIDRNLYTGILGVTPVKGGSYNINLTQTTPLAFKAQIDAL